MPTAVLRHRLRPRRDQPHDLVPTDPFTAGYGTDRHHPHIGYQLPSQTPCQVPLELGMLLKVTLVAVAAHEPATLPHQGDRPIPDPSVTNPTRSHIMHRLGLEPAPPTARHRPPGLDLDHEAADRVLQHPHHTNPVQVQPDRHIITSHRGPPAIGLLFTHRLQPGPDPYSRTPGTALPHTFAKPRETTPAGSTPRIGSPAIRGVHTAGAVPATARRGVRRMRPVAQRLWNRTIPGY